MTEDTQCETMGLQATSPPTSPLHRPPPPHPGSIGSSTPMLKRKHDLVEDDDEDVLMSVTTGGSGVKKICVEVVASHNVVSNMNRNNDRLNNSDEDIEDFSSDSDEANSSSDDESKSSSMLDDSIMLTESSNESTTCSASVLEENKENQVNVNKVLNKNGELESILAKTLLNSTTAAQTSNNTSNTTDMPNKNDNDHCPKVIVEHKPLPSIYDLQQMSAACDTLEDDNMQTNNAPKENDSGVSDDEDEDEVSSDLEDEEAESGDEEDEEPSPSPIFDPVLRGTKPGSHNTLPSPPKAIYGNDQRSFWNQNAYNNPQQPQQQSNTFQFLEQTTQRIECAENGKSYLQLGTMNHAAHHHLPVTPVIQPKPNMVYRRPIPPFRTNHMVSAISSNLSAASAFGSASTQSVSQPRPVCDHSNCLQKKNSFCYQSQRSRMLNLSLSKLHMARQSHDGSLRRSVLICNMLRYIEDETDREASVETSGNSIPPQQYGAMETEHHQYWPPVSQPQQQPPQPQQQPQAQVPISSPVSTNGGLTGVQDAPVYNMAGQSQPQSPQPGQPPQSYSTEPYEATLKDFNSAFRSTPYASPAHPGSDLDSGLGLGDNSEMERGINWSSVLSLTSSQSELDPLNNNTFATEAWPNTANTPTTLSSVQQPTLTDISSSTVASSRTMSDLATSMVTSSAVSTSVTTVQQTSFDDIGWKLSADDVLKAFPNDENLFGAVTGP